MKFSAAEDVASDDLGDKCCSRAQSDDAIERSGDMKERLLTLALAIGAFVAFYAVMAPKPEGPRQQATRPISTEERPERLSRHGALAGVERVPVPVAARAVPEAE